jgi:hypothetical protein
VEQGLGLTNFWNLETLEDYLKSNYSRGELKKYMSIPFLVMWGTWLARNESIFEDKSIPSFRTSTQLCVIFHMFKCISKVVKVNPKVGVVVNRTYAWGVFNTACQESICSS